MTTEDVVALRIRLESTAKDFDSPYGQNLDPRACREVANLLRDVLAVLPAAPAHDAECESELTSHGYTDCRCAERAAAPAPEAEPEPWQPIETAPTDDDVLGGAYHKAYGWLWDRATYHRFPALKKKEWICKNGMAPTHWLPLPKPPGVLSRPEGA